MKIAARGWHRLPDSAEILLLGISAAPSPVHGALGIVRAEITFMKEEYE